MPFELNLPETAKALSAPMTKLIEVIAAGCGKVYEPTGIRRKATAEGQALVIMEEARSRASEISVRAAQRLIDTEERRQRNIESITHEAAKLLPEEVSSEPVDEDWAARFFVESQDIGAKEMQDVWAKILAGEVTKPGSFSRRTLSVLKDISIRDAQAFNTLCKNSFRDIRGAPLPLISIPQGSEFWNQLGLNFTALRRLEDAGLLEFQAFGIVLKNVTGALLFGSNKSLAAKTDSPDSFSLGRVDLTSAGVELAGICEWEVPQSRLDELLAADMSPFTLTLVETARVENGVRINPVDSK
jgi:hypothetical protein